ncbi:MAG: secondary thiamine-phosphate synthase enzyme [Deltaproteobacteria bacterium CG11_big_fil_rev_8_21_14_0_20_49_13]|nr:MAG: secondary thiamine-phosphate synthase enzyme [Deltaproteobacteria bacterium CG11_big_fil_rev_8_21_14_0_20_49_13]
MNTHSDLITIKSGAHIEFVEIRDKVAAAINRSNVKNGIAILTTQHTTTAVCINEKCSRLQEDMKEALKCLVPVNADYKHDHSSVDGRNNAHSHLMSLFLKTNEIVPITDGKMALGTWQSIFFIELDGPRPERNIRVTIIGNDE